MIRTSKGVLKHVSKKSVLERGLKLVKPEPEKKSVLQWEHPKCWVRRLSPGSTFSNIISECVRSPDLETLISTLALEATLARHDTDIKTLMNTLNNFRDADVWAYATRTLTPHAFPFTNPPSPVDLANVKLTVAVDPSNVWTYVTRTLTNPASYKADISALALEATLGTHNIEIKALINALNNLAQSDVLNDATPFAGADIATIKTETESHPTLAEIEASTLLSLIVHLDADISSRSSHNAAAIWATPSRELSTPANYMADLSTLEARLSAIRAGYFDNLNNAQLLNIPDLSTLSATRIAKLDNIDTLLSTLRATEFARITADVATEAKQDIIDGTIDDVLTDTADIQPRVPRIVCSMDFWSDKDDEFLLNTTADDKALPDVVVSGLPADITIIRVVAIFMCRAIEDTSAGANAINGEQYIQMRKAAGSWTNAIKLVDNLWAVADSIREMGDAFPGNIDLHTTVDGDATYNFQTHNVVVDGVSLKFNDLQVGLRVYFTI